LVSEIPAYLDWLRREFAIPSERTSRRFGVEAWHHPELVQEVNALGPASTLLSLIDQADIWQRFENEWSGTALELRAILIEHHKTQRDARKLLNWTNACGQYLKELAKNHPERVKEYRRAKERLWVIYRNQEAENNYE
jgi:hypothetical protein